MIPDKYAVPGEPGKYCIPVPPELTTEYGRLRVWYNPETDRIEKWVPPMPKYTRKMSKWQRTLAYLKRLFN